jgi:hypothetical protein
MVAQTLVSEVGLDMSRWKTEAHFASWLIMAKAGLFRGAILAASIRMVCKCQLRCLDSGVRCMVSPELKGPRPRLP